MLRRKYHHSFGFFLCTNNGIDFFCSSIRAFFRVVVDHFWSTCAFYDTTILVLLSFTFPMQTRLNFGLCSSSFLILSIVLNFPSILIFDIKGLDCSFPRTFFSNLSMV